MLVKLWDISILAFVEVPGLLCLGACSVQFAKEFCSAAISWSTFWAQGSSGLGVEECSSGESNFFNLFSNLENSFPTFDFAVLNFPTMMRGLSRLGGSKKAV